MSVIKCGSPTLGVMTGTPHPGAINLAPIGVKLRRVTKENCCEKIR
jgi:hypothetical protein